MFPSRTKLFKHININHQEEGALNVPTRKIALLVGYMPSNDLSNTNHQNMTNSNGLSDKLEVDILAHLGGRPLFRDGDNEFDVMNQSLWKALYAMNNNKKVIVTTQHKKATAAAAAAAAEEEDKAASVESTKLGAEEGKETLDLESLRPPGWSRCNATDARCSGFLSQAPTTPSVSELVVFTSPVIPENTEQEWVNLLNKKLIEQSQNDKGNDDNGYVIQVHGRCNVPSSSHAERNCELRRYEMIIPLKVLAPELIEESLSNKQLNHEQKLKVINTLNQELQQELQAEEGVQVDNTSCKKEEKKNKTTFTLIEEEPTSQNGWENNWKQFSKKLKLTMKQLQGRYNWHNFAPGVLPHDQTAAVSKIIRFKHATIVRACSLNQNNNQDQNQDQDGDDISIDECFLVLSLHGNMFLRGMCESMCGLLIAVIRNWLPESYIETSLRPDIILSKFPRLPSTTLYFIEGRYDNFENKCRVKLCPGKINMNAFIDTSKDKKDKNNEILNENELRIEAKIKKRKLDWKCEKCNENNFAKRTTCFKCEFTPPASIIESNDDRKEEIKWCGFLNEYCNIVNEKKHLFRELILKKLILKELKEQNIMKWSVEMERQQDIIRESFKLSINNVAPMALQVSQSRIAAAAADKKLKEKLNLENEEDDVDVDLELFKQREEEKLELENENKLSILKQLNPSSDIKNEIYHKTLFLLREADASDQWPSSSLTRSKIILEGGRSSISKKKNTPLKPGGTFALGAMPPPLEFPKSNQIFKELLVSCFQLERILKPNRKPSSTIAVNRHAQFTPHVDTGSGAGQSNSLIVALGDFIGGEIVIESQAHDIRYNPIEFNGWTQRHWTKPFTGERFSLVWFTPLGCEDMAGINM